MADHAGFLEAIGDEPDDDTPRLIYADWLEEHGEPERAEFIRLQCRAASLPKRLARAACGGADRLAVRAWFSRFRTSALRAAPR
jgi:uncharacterized protein (TIGR02996 family)